MADSTEKPTPNREITTTKPKRSRSSHSVLIWLCLVLIIVFFGYHYAITRVDQKLTSEVLKRLRMQLPEYVIQLDRASLQPGASITLEGIQIAKRLEGQHRDVFRGERVVCYGPIDWIGLCQGQVPVQRVVADGVEISLWPLGNGKWCIPESNPSFKLSVDFPEIEVRSGIVRVGHEAGIRAQEIVCHDLRFKAALLPIVPNLPKPAFALGIEAQVSSSHFNTLRVTASIDETKTNWQCRGELTDLEFSPRVQAQIPACLQANLSAILGLSVHASAKFAVTSQQGKLDYYVHATADRGRWQHPQLAYPLDDVQGELMLNNSVLQVRNVKARCGDAYVKAALDSNGLSMKSPLTAVVEVEDLELDQRLYRSLPKNIQEIWTKLEARGHLNAQALVRYDGIEWDPRIVVDTKDLSVFTEFFPFPVTQIQGRFVYEHGRLFAPDLVARAANQGLTGSLELIRAQPKWLMDFHVSSDGPIEIDGALLQSLTPRNAKAPSGLHQFVESLHPSGTIHLKRGRFQRTADNPNRISRSLEFLFSECSLKYDRFRYPISEVHGEATLDNDRLILRDFVGRNDGARIKAHGTCQLQDAELDSIDLTFDAYDLAMDEELRNALPKGVQSLWDEIQPVGMMGHTQVELRKRAKKEPLDVRVEMIKESFPDEGVGRSLAFRPKSLPYSINDVACQIMYSPGKIDILSLTGSHDSSRLNAEGYYRVYADGSWDGTIKWIPSTRFLVDQTFLSCLPTYLRDPLMRLDFRGPVNISGSTFVASNKIPGESIVRAWDIDLEIEDGRLGGGGIASGMRGTIAMTGENTADGPMAYGSLEFDALAVKGVPVIGLTGPFALTKHEVIFGRDAVNWQDTYVRQKQAKAMEQGNNVTIAVANSPVSRPDRDVVQASFRNNMHNRLDAKFAKLANTQVGQIAMTKRSVAKDVPQLDVSTNDITAEALSGRLFVTGVEPLDGRRAKYKVRLLDANLRDCLLDLGEPAPQTNGALWMQCDVAGSITNMTSIEGDGKVWLRNANLYQLPVMIRLFNLLSVRPDQSAFDAVDVRFRIDGDRIPIEELSFDGNLVSLRGTGWVNMRRELQLELDASVSRRTLVGAVMRPLSNDYPANLFRIDVTGTTSDPIVRSNVSFMGQMQKAGP